LKVVKSSRSLLENPILGGCWKMFIPIEIGTKFLGMRRTYRYAAVTKNEDNAADVRFPTAF